VPCGVREKFPRKETEAEEEKYDDQWPDEKLPQPEFVEHKQVLQTETKYYTEREQVSSRWFDRVRADGARRLR